MLHSSDWTLWVRKYQRYIAAGMPMVTATRVKRLAALLFASGSLPSQ